MFRSTVLVLAASVVVSSLVGCGKKPAQSPTEVTSAETLGLRVSNDIMKACKIQLENVDRAPKFDFDDADLQPEDRDVLEQVAKCFTTGPLRGRHLDLVGRCDQRGETEYNMALGEFRAESVHDYLAKLGVETAAMAKTSRGELDAEGKNEDGWRRDRRVDIALAPENAKSVAQR